MTDKEPTPGDEVHLLDAGDRIYRQFIEAVSEGTVTLTADGEIRSCNAGFAGMVRRPLDQVLGSALRDHLSPDDLDILCSVLAQACPESSRHKVRLKTSEGRLVPVYLSATLLHGAGAAPVCCLVFTNLEEVISAEETLRESEERYRVLFENSPDAVLLTVPDGTILSANPVACHMFGRTMEELRALGRASIIDTGDLRLARLLEERARTGRASGELTFLRRDGATFPGEISSLLFRDRLGAMRASMIIRDITERKQAEEELRSSHLLYRQTLSSLNESVIVVDVNTRLVLDCNQTTESIFGYSREELVGRDTRWLHVNEETFAAFAEETLAQIAEKGFAEFEFQMRRKNGDVFPTEHFLRPLQKDDGSRLGVVSVVRDITERKRAEDALQASRQLTEGIINAIPVRVFWKDRNLVFLGCNASFARDAGFADPQQVVGKDDFQMVWREHADLYRDDDRRVIESGEPRLLIEEPQATPDGRTITLLTSKLPLRNAAGEIIGVLGMYIDITERKRVEMDRLQLSVAIEQAGETVMITDARGRIRYVNPVFETITGYRREEVLGKSARLLKSSEHDAALYRKVLSTLKSGRVWRGRLVNSRKDGVLFTVDSTISPVRDEKGLVVSYVGVERDVTEELRLVEEKDRLEQQLLQAQRVEAIGRLAGGIAHDFNNLTAIVLGYGEMLLGHLGPDETAHKWVEQILAAGNRSATLTRQLLAFGRKQVLLPVVLDLNDLLRNLERMLARLIGEDIELKFDLAGDLGRITADPGQIEQVITNLVINARDAMPKGGRLAFETANANLDESFAREHQGMVPGEYVRLVLTDTGCGMDTVTLARLFEPFFTTKEMGKGTGLGLATAFGIVKQSGGYLSVESEPGKGTKFTIYLPRTSAPVKETGIDFCGEMPQGSGERILLVEDEASLRELCTVVLSGRGYRVSAAASGPEALALAEEQGIGPDLVLTDVIMPGMSGAELVQRLRRDRPDLKALYMSGYPDAAIAPHGVLGPDIAFLQKPFSERVLAAKVCEVLGNRKSAATHSVRRVLMIDDDEQFLDLVGYFCRKRGHSFAGVDSAAAALAALAEAPFDVLLVDLNIPGTSGERVLREIRAAGYAAPAIVLTGDVGSADMDLLRPLGVVRAIEKSSNPEPLLPEIEKVAALGGPPRDTGAP